MRLLILTVLLRETSAYWDEGTTTRFPDFDTPIPRQSFFKWQHVTYQSWMASWFWSFDHWGNERRRNLCVIAGISYEFLPVTSGIILNRRTIITSSNPLDRYMDRQSDLRLWALGASGGTYISPYRYRVWRIKRVVPKSNNPEHWHGIRGTHQPRHDICIVLSVDQIFLNAYWPNGYHNAFKAWLPKQELLHPRLFIAGCGFLNMLHIQQNYEINFKDISYDTVVDCSIYLPKWWGKFICMKNLDHLPGLQSGSGLMGWGKPPTLFALGCFEIRYNEVRIFVFTDIRYYFNWICVAANIEPGDYYEYAYPEYSTTTNWLNIYSHQPAMPTFYVKKNIWPLG